MTITRVGYNIYLVGDHATGYTVFSDGRGGWTVANSNGETLSRHGSKGEAFAAVPK